MKKKQQRARKLRKSEKGIKTKPAWAPYKSRRLRVRGGGVAAEDAAEEAVGAADWAACAAIR